jgi:hypothetical protein
MSHASELPPPDYERSDGAPRAVLFAATGIVGLIALTVLASGWWYAAQYREAPVVRARGGEFSFTRGPQQRTSIQRDWATQDAFVREHLHTYGWIDREAHVVRIPIERAMELIATEAAPQKTEP